MKLEKPKSMDECMYFTNRGIGDGYAVAWVYRKTCPDCGKGRLRKPLKKNGKPDKNADHYLCPKCGRKVDNKDAESDLTLEVEFKCPHCGHEDQTTSEYKRKKYQRVDAYVFLCTKCSKKIPLTKKLKDV